MGFDNSELKSRKTAGMKLSDFGDSIIHQILTKLDPQDKARFACVNPYFRVSASDESLWSLHCFQDLHLSSPSDPFGSPLPSFRVAYQVWRKAFSMYPWILVKRVIECHDQLKSWLKINLPAVADTLRRGATEDELNEFEESLGVKLPTPSRVLYRIFDGQDLQMDELCGLIGGYSFHNQSVNVYLLSLKEIRMQTEELRCRQWCPRTSEYLVVAESPFDEKVFLLNCGSGQMYVGTYNFEEDGEMMPCVPATLLSFIGRHDNDKIQDGLLLWLEEHNRRLHNGIIGIRGEGGLKGIIQFPELPSLCYTAVTNGVQVRVSGVFAPEMSDLQAHEKYHFAYSIRMSLLPEGCTLHGMRHDSCQLYWRRWIIRENDTVVQDFSGEPFDSEHPLLFAGDNEFVYQSSISLSGIPVSMEGSFLFVPGSLEDPGGDDLEVEGPRFSLELPHYIF